MDASMMMSQRPSASASRPQATSSTGNTSTIGKYKGVMLCNRPNRGPAQAGNTANRAMGSSGLVPFRAGGHNPIENDIGLTRAKPKRHAAPRKKVESVTAKHKKWLKNYTAAKLTVEAELEKQEEEKKKKREAFMARERRMRNAILKNVKKGDDESSDDEGRSVPQTSARSQTRDEELEELLKFTQDINEEDFEKQMESMLEDEEKADWMSGLIEEGKLDDAIEFDPESDDNELVHPDTGESGYDGDDAISRKEWRQRMVETVDPETGEPSDEDDAISRRDYLTSQGVDVQRVHASDERRRAALKGAMAAGLTAEALEEWKKREGSVSTKGQDSKAYEEDDVMSTASSVLQDSKRIRSVHSARSVVAVAKQNQRKKTFKLPEIREIKPPVIVTLDEKRLDYKKHPNQLPYMNRNPAV